MRRGRSSAGRRRLLSSRLFNLVPVPLCSRGRLDICEQSGSLARAALRRVEGHARYAAHEAAGRRQGPACADSVRTAMGQCAALPDRSRTDHDAHGVRRGLDLPARRRPHRPPRRDQDCSGRDPARAPDGPAGRGLLRGIHVKPWSARHRGKLSADPLRGQRSDSLCRGHGPRHLRAGMGEPFLEGAVPGGPGGQGASFALSGSAFTGPLLLGQLRSRLLEVLGPAGDAATRLWNHRASGRGCRAGVLRVLGGPLALSASRLLLVHVSEAGRDRAAADRAGGGFVEPGARRVCSSLRGRSKQRVASRGDAPVFREPLRRGRPPGQLGAGPFCRTRPLSSVTALSRRLHVTVRPPRDPGFAALRRAARAAIVIPLAFAFADLLLREPQSLVFVMFGCFSLLVISDFGGFRRQRALAYLTSTLVGAALVALGTLVSTSTWLPAVVMFVVGFAISFSRIFGGYVAAANLRMLLAFVIAVMIPD